MDGWFEVGAGHWLVLGLALLGAELATGSTYLLWPAAAAWVTGAVVLAAPLPLPAQLLVFGALTLVLSLTAGRMFKPGWARAGGDDKLNDRASQLVGARGVAVTDFAGGAGRVRLGDTEWTGTCSAAAISAGQEVEVVAVTGATLVVRPVSPMQIGANA